MTEITINNAIDDFILEQKARLNAKKTIKDYREKLTMWATFAGEKTVIDSVTTKDMRLYIASLSERGLARETIRSYITALKVAWKFWSLEYGVEDVTANIKKPVKKRQPPKSISTSDFVKLFEAAKGFNPIDWRNRALIALLADTGARRGELLTLTTDIDLIHRKALVTGKTGSRTIFWTHYTNNILFRWIAVRPQCESDVLFVSIREGRHPEPLTGSGIRQILVRLKKAAGIKGRVNPHAFRHKFAQEYLKAGGDVVTLAHLGGWRDLQTIKDAYAVFSDDELSRLQEENSPLLAMIGVKND